MKGNFSIFQKFIKYSNSIPSISKTTICSTPPYTYLQINASSSYSVKTKLMDGHRDGHMDGRTGGGVHFNISRLGPLARREIITIGRLPGPGIEITTSWSCRLFCSANISRLHWDTVRTQMRQIWNKLYISIFWGLLWANDESLLVANQSKIWWPVDLIFMGKCSEIINPSWPHIAFWLVDLTTDNLYSWKTLNFNTEVV